MVPREAATAREAANGSSLNRSVLIAGADPALRRRLFQTLAAGGAERTIEHTPIRPDLSHLVATFGPSVILVDLGAKPDARAIASVSTLSAVAKTIVLADVDDDAVAIRALKAGASGFCARNIAPSVIRKAVQLVEAGEIWVERRFMLGLIEELAILRASETRDLPGASGLTVRERELAQLVARGASNKQIATHLSISIKTVKTHLTSIFRKLGLATRVQLAVALTRVPSTQSSPQTKVG